MPWWNSHRSKPTDTATENTDPPDECVFDDGGSGLYEACTARFTQYGWTVACDERHAVWITGAHGSLAVGLAPWMLNLRSLDETLDDVETRIKEAEAKLPV